MTSTTQDANEAKLRVAADHGLRAKFSYQHDFDPVKEVRIYPDTIFQGTVGPVVGGNTADGVYKNYRVDRITDEVIVK